MQQDDERIKMGRSNLEATFGQQPLGIAVRDVKLG